MSKNGSEGRKSGQKLLYRAKSYFSVQANVLIVLFAVLLLVATA